VSKKKKTRTRNYFWIVFAAMLLLCVLMGMRSGQTVLLVLDDPAAVSDTRPNTSQTDYAGLAHRDSLLAAAAIGDRDPFRPVPVRTRRKTSVRQVKQQVLPTLKALLFDHVNPTARLNIGEEVSGWLRVGDSFQGWNVTEITESSVKLAQGKKALILP